MLDSIAPLCFEDAQAGVEAEGGLTIRWLSEGESTLEGTEQHISPLAREAEYGKCKRAFGICVDGRCVGTVDVDPDVTDGLEPGDVNSADGVTSWVSGCGVELICATIRKRAVGTRAVIRADSRNPASSRVAEKASFLHLRDVELRAERLEDDGEAVRVYERAPG